MCTEWQRPKTTRLYLQPPKSERFYTLWREGKVVFGEIQQPITEYDAQTSAGIWFTDERGCAFEYHKGAFFVREDGIPVHVLKHKLKHRLFVTIESFGAPGRRSSCYVKLTVKNPTELDIESKIGFLLRTDLEKNLIFQSPDLYASYSPDIATWRDIAPTWREVDGGYADDDRVLMCDTDIDFAFDEKTGSATANVKVPAGESVTAVFAYDIGRTPDTDYESRRAETVKYWGGELARINSLPDSIAGDADKVKLIKNLTVQLLQCFCYPVGEDFLLERQGGLQRQVWAFEAISVLESLDRIGSFEDYIEPIIDTYFGVFHNETGEITPLSISWAMITGNALYSFAKYAVTAGKAYFEKYRDRAFASFEWIKNTRASTVASDNTVAGIFPAKSSCDDPLVFQSWCNTDTFNLRGIHELYQCFAHFGDSAANEIKAEYEDYLSVMRGLWQRLSDKEKSDEISIPHSPIVPEELIASKFLFGDFSGYLVEGIDMPLEDAMRVLNYYTRRGFFKGGLYDRMPDHKSVGSSKQNLDEDGKCLVWYVCVHEYYWFYYFLRHGMKDKCEEIMRDNLLYAITDEYYMVERFNIRDPWFAPWSPNASANGRTINMLLDLYS